MQKVFTSLMLFFLLSVGSGCIPNGNGQMEPSLTYTQKPSVTSNPTATLQPKVLIKSGSIEFSYIPPRGWKEYDISGSEYKGWENGEFATLGFYALESEWNSAEEGKELIQGGVKFLYKDFTIIDEGIFDPIIKNDAYFVTFTGEINALPHYVKYYFFRAEKFIVYANYSRLVDKDQELDYSIEECMKTVSLLFEI